MHIAHSSRPSFRGFWLAPTFLIACAATSSRREDSLWREARHTPTAAIDAPVDVGAPELDRDALVREVLARNPDVAAAREALRAALAAVPEAWALDDPMLAYEVAPLSIAGAAHFGQRVTIRQRVPWPGKRARAAEVALAAAEAVSAEIGIVRLELAAMASELFDERYVVERALQINTRHQVLVEEIRQSALARYTAGQAAQQDPIQAEAELAALARDRVMLEAERDQLVARMNGLLHRAPGAPLPGPPAELVLAPVPDGTSEALQDLALRERPQRDAARARIRLAEAEIAMAERERYPDVEVMASYDSMWDMPEHRWMVGAMIDVPIQRGKRRAGIARGRAERARMQLMDARLVDDIRVEVDRVHRRVVEAAALVEIQERRVLPAARDRVAAARAGFVAGQNPFMAVAEAERALREGELGLETARAELSRRRAALSRAVGLVPGLDEGRAP